MTWPSRNVEIETGSWTVDDLCEGDLVFGQKDSGPLAWLCGHADEPWRHVGSLIDDGGELKLVEVLGDAFRLRELKSFFDHRRYAAWGAARLRVGPKCVAGANEWMRAHLQGGDHAEQVYAWDDLILAGIISATQRGLLASHPERVRAAIWGAGQFCKYSLKYQGKVSLTCSSFVQFAYEHAGGECAIEHRRWRNESGSWPDRSPQIDELFEMTASELARFDDISLLDLFLDDQRASRGTATTQARPGQVGEALKVMLAAIGGYAVGEAPPDGLGVDSRWVTPGDLWRSPSVYERALVIVS